ncbi:hypothetical protein EV421DRAFT_1750900 [Armillaria borealis]|uniref:Secreted protein n=1 Tax=Armillaria borealis TaxID=47425 RepID=A0AA39KA19_9AGAR|nr:hypothetical protein EV421DRAFT_1750900 [Armillaria borealis]
MLSLFLLLAFPGSCNLGSPFTVLTQLCPAFGSSDKNSSSWACFFSKFLVVTFTLTHPTCQQSEHTRSNSHTGCRSLASASASFLISSKDMGKGALAGMEVMEVME